MRTIITTCFCLTMVLAKAQLGGQHAFGFLNLPAHARVAGLGGVNVSLADRDVNFFHNNPALAGDTLSGMLSGGYQFFVADIGNALFTYSHDLGKRGQLIAGIQHVGYGSLQGFDEQGMETLEHRAAETAVVVGRTHQIGHFRFGVTLKGVFSNIAGYRAEALLADVGGVFLHPETSLNVALVLKNFGLVLGDYTADASLEVPFDVQAGVTFKPEYMPLRFSVTGHHLARAGRNEYPMENPSLASKVLTHLTVGAEILVHRNVNVLAGYNHLLRQSLRWETGSPLAGVCYGFALHLKPVEFIFSRSGYSAGNAGYSFTLSTNTNQFLKRRS